MSPRTVSLEYDNENIYVPCPSRFGRKKSTEYKWTECNIIDEANETRDQRKQRSDSLTWRNKGLGGGYIISLFGEVDTTTTLPTLAFLHVPDDDDIPLPAPFLTKYLQLSSTKIKELRSRTSATCAYSSCEKLQKPFWVHSDNEADATAAIGKAESAVGEAAKDKLNLTNVKNAIWEAEELLCAGAVAHMNEVHAGAVLLMAQGKLHNYSAESAEIRDFDISGFHVSAAAGDVSGKQSRVEFFPPLSSAGDFRVRVADMTSEIQATKAAACVPIYAAAAHHGCGCSAAAPTPVATT